jgi:hypothetical protein
MKRIKIALVLLFLFSSIVPGYTGDLDKPYSPTRKEWVEISTFRAVKNATDAWQHRISSVIWVKEKESTIFITLTSANGQAKLSQKAIDKYVSMVKNAIETLILLCHIK